MEKLKNLFLNKYFLAPTFLMYSYSIWKRNVNRELKGATFDSKIYRPLEKKEASRRHDHISNISYDLLLNLSNLDNNIFKGEIIIEFFLSQVENLFLDFKGKIKSLQVNKKICLNSSEYKKKANRIYIEERVLNKGRNLIKIEFEQSYGVEDGLIYCKNRNFIFSKCESFNAHHIFPCFDQPSFKTKFKLNIISDKNIEFISNSNLKTNTLLINNQDFNSSNFNTLSLYPANYDNSYKNKEFRIYEFLEISKIATHQIFICGIYNYTEDFLEEEFKDSQLLIKINKNKNINNPDLISSISKISREYINWFKDVFQTEYPFNNLSIYFLKEITNLSMSFPGGIIVLDEKFLESDLDTIDKNYFYLILATHVSQMWLSHDISIKWWDDVFFFEAINLFLASLFFDEIRKSMSHEFNFFDNTFLSNLFDFFKSKAISADKSMDCHQVILDIDDTQEADILVNDEITLFKTACLIKYLYSMHKSNFLSTIKSMINYSCELNPKSASYRDFVENYENLENSNEQNNEFSPIQQFKYYLVNESIPRLYSGIPKFSDDGTFNKIFVVQEYPDIIKSLKAQLEKEEKNDLQSEDEIYYPYTTDILLKYEDTEIIIPIQIKPKKINVITLDSRYPKPLCMVINPNDSSYTTQKFDDNTRTYLIDKTNELNESARLMIIREFFHLVKQGDMDPLVYIKFCENLLTKESNIYLINKVITQTISIINDYIPISSRSSQKQHLFKLLSEKYFKKELYQKHLYKNMTNFLLDLNNSRNPDNIKFLLESCLEINIEDECDSDNQYQEDIMENSKRYELKHLDFKTMEKLVEAIYESERFTQITKESLKRKILHENNVVNENITFSKKTFETCNLINNEESYRKGLWKLFVYKDKLFPVEQIRAYMKGFNREIIKFPLTKSNESKESNIKFFFKKRFFKDFPYVSQNHSHEYSILFYECLRPNFLIEEKILKKFMKLKKKLNFDDHPNIKLRFFIENDINDLKHKLLVIKNYSNLQLTGLKQSTFRKI